MTNSKGNVKTNWLLLGVIAGLILILFPILIAGILSNAERIYNVETVSSHWIGFWGSYLGGVLGTVGVIFVAYLQNESQKSSMRTIESNNLKRLRIQTLLELTNKYSKDLNKLSSDITNIQSKIKKIIELLKDLDEIKKRNSNNDSLKIDKKNKLIRSIIQELKDDKIPGGFISHSMVNLEYQNLLLSNEGLIISPVLSGEEALYFDKIIDCLTSEDYNNDKLKLLLEKTQTNKDEHKVNNKDFRKVAEWLLIEKTNISQSSSNLLHSLKESSLSMKK